MMPGLTGTALKPSGSSWARLWVKPSIAHLLAQYGATSAAADYARGLTPIVLLVCDLEFDTGTLQATRGGQAITLTPISRKLLLALMKASPRVLSRRALEREAWGDITPDSDALRSHLYNLRKAIDKPFDKPLLHNIQGMGYRLAETADG